MSETANGGAPPNRLGVGSHPRVTFDRNLFCRRVARDSSRSSVRIAPIPVRGACCQASPALCHTRVSGLFAGGGGRRPPVHAKCARPRARAHKGNSGRPLSPSPVPHRRPLLHHMAAGSCNGHAEACPAPLSPFTRFPLTPVRVCCTTSPLPVAPPSPSLVPASAAASAPSPPPPPRRLGIPPTATTAGHDLRPL